MGKTNTRLETARLAYREALEAARTSPTPEAWTRLLAAGKELSLAQEPKPRTSRRRSKGAIPTLHDLEGGGQEPPSREFE